MKKLLALALAMIMALGLVTFASAEGEAMTTWYTFNDDYLSSVRAALGEAFNEKGIKNADQDSNGTQATQIDQIQTAIANKVGVLVVNLVESGSQGTAENIINDAKNAGIPIVFFNRSLAESEEGEKALLTSYDKAAYVGTVYTEAGIMQGKLIGQYVLDNFDKLDLNGDGEISYVMLKGDEANLEAIARTKYGHEEADKILEAAGKKPLKFYDDSNANRYIVDQAGQWSVTHGFDTLQNILSQYNAENNNMVELVIANNDSMAIGAVNALVEKGYNTGEEGATVIPVFGVDATADAMEAIKAGKMTGTIKQDAVGMADAVATIAANFLAGKDAFAELNENYVQVENWKVTIPYSMVTGE
ncbi:MAG: galactose ABC transporter substrate-binding protein [Christensenellales bacterium]|jgi:methyl-galactoside transport system substrate-binding protein